jgi:DeoR family suf operon transcriptional repressor
MQLATAPVAGFRGLRADILLALKKAQPLTAKELAQRFAVTPNALRRHLKELEADGIVRHDREVRGVGGPTYAFRLSEAGEALFPRAYAPALLDALEVVRETSGIEGVTEMFERHWAAAARSAEPELSRLPLPERARRLAELLTTEGYMAEAEARSSTEATIRQHNCAIRAVAERFPEVCDAEVRFIAETLGASVERQSHILDGCNACAYSISAPRTDDGRWRHTADEE